MGKARDLGEDKFEGVNSFTKGLSVAVGLLTLVIGLYVPHLMQEEEKNQEFREQVAGHMAGTESTTKMILMILQGDLNGLQMAKGK